MQQNLSNVSFANTFVWLSPTTIISIFSLGLKLSKLLNVENGMILEKTKEPSLEALHCIVSSVVSSQSFHNWLKVWAPITWFPSPAKAATCLHWVNLFKGFIPDNFALTVIAFVFLINQFWKLAKYCMVQWAMIRHCRILNEIKVTKHLHLTDFVSMWRWGGKTKHPIDREFTGTMDWSQTLVNKV